MLRQRRFRNSALLAAPAEVGTAVEGVEAAAADEAGVVLAAPKTEPLFPEAADAPNNPEAGAAAEDAAVDAAAVKLEDATTAGVDAGFESEKLT